MKRLVEEISGWLERLLETARRGDLERYRVKAVEQDYLKKVSNPLLELHRIVLSRYPFVLSSAATAAGSFKNARSAFVRLTSRRPPPDVLELLVEARVILSDPAVLRALKEEDQAEVIKRNETAAHELHALLQGYSVDFSDISKQPCAGGTRTQLLADIHAWIGDVSPAAPSFYWLAGTAGSGKSSISASVVEECEKKDVLAGKYLFNRLFSLTTDPASLFPSLAGQLGQDIRVGGPVGTDLLLTLRARPALVADPFATQLLKLFVIPLRQLASQGEKNALPCLTSCHDANQATSPSVSDPSRPFVIIIDALDECLPSKQEAVAEMLAKLSEHDLPTNVKIIVTSRQEDIMMKHFQPLVQAEKIAHCLLDPRDKENMMDITTYIRSVCSDPLETGAVRTPC